MNPWKISTFALVALLAAVVGGSWVNTASAKEAQPHMRSALVNLRQAKSQLEKADADKGGHRVKAIELTTQAIEQVEKGIAFDSKD